MLSDDEAATSAGEDTESKEDKEVAETEARAKQPMYDFDEPEEEIAKAEVEPGSSEGLELGARIKKVPFLTAPEVPGQAAEVMRLWQATVNYVLFCGQLTLALSGQKCVHAGDARQSATALVKFWRWGTQSGGP